MTVRFLTGKISHASADFKTGNTLLVPHQMIRTLWLFYGGGGGNALIGEGSGNDKCLQIDSESGAAKIILNIFWLFGQGMDKNVCKPVILRKTFK